MAFVEINPPYESLLRRQNLLTPARLLALPGVIVSGHPDRNVARVRVGPVVAYLKREHGVRWRDRLVNALAGFGFSSGSVREARALKALGHLSCVPDWLAFGEGDDGRAFLLVRQVDGATDLPSFLRGLPDGRAIRLRVARQIGRAIAQVHAAGFDHPELSAKHVLISRRGGHVTILDWQRARVRLALGRRVRRRDLAMLHATLPDKLAGAGERLACLRAYSAASRRALATASAPMIHRQALRLLRGKRVRQAREGPTAFGQDGVVWLDGEAVCATEQFWGELGENRAAWLECFRSGVMIGRNRIALPDGRPAVLIAARRRAPLRWLWSLVRGKPFMADEVRQAGVLFRLRLQGVAAPRLLAFGQRRPRPWLTESFILTEPAATADGGAE